uniref:GTP cyclohydrolase MptA n=1 Tax=Geoglobus ahangari TaxID=113653 RepID=A0A7C3UIG2_9EURY
MLPDVQLLKPEVEIGLSRVGAKNIRKLVQVKRNSKRPIILISNFDVYVDLPSTRKGVNLSRNFEAVDEVIESLTQNPVENIEDLNLRIVDELLKRHEYATKAEVLMEAEFILKKRTPTSNQKTQEVVKIYSEAAKWRSGETKVFVGAEVYGITVCPCAQELIKAYVTDELKKAGFNESQIKEIMRIIPFASHNQRGRSFVKVEIKENFKPRIEDIIEIAKSGMSFEIYEILKRSDELEVVKEAHMNPRFVEDAVRIMAKKAVEKFSDAPNDVLVYFRQINEESIHQHDVLAERFATIGELRDELG